MVNQELLNYIRETSKKGFSNDDIRDALINSGWRLDDIKDAFDRVKEIENEQIIINQKGSVKKKFIGIVVGGLVFLLTASSAFGGYYYYSTIPVRTLNKMKDKAGEIKSFEFNSVLKFSSNGQKIDVQLDSSGAADFSDKDNSVSYSSHNFNFSSPKDDILATLNIRNVGGVNYLLVNLPSTSENSSANIIIKMLGIQQNKWIRIDPAEVKDILPLKKSFGENNQKVLPGSSFNINYPSSFLGASILGFTGNINASGENKNSQTKKITSLEDIIKNYHLFKVKEYLGKEIVQDNIKARHIQFDLDRSELIRLIMDNYEGSGPYNLEEYQKEVIDELNSIKSMSGDIWVGSYDSYLYKFALQVIINDKETGDAEMDFVINFSNINKPVSIEAPSESESILDVLKRTGLK